MNLPSFGYGSGDYKSNLAAYGYGAGYILPQAGYICLMDYAATVEFAEYGPTIMQQLLAPVVAFLEKTASVLFDEQSASIGMEYTEPTVEMSEQQTASVGLADRSPSVDLADFGAPEIEEQQATVSLSDRSGASIAIQLIPEGQDADCG